MTTDEKHSEAEFTTGQTPRATRPTLFARIGAAWAGQEQSGVQKGEPKSVEKLAHEVRSSNELAEERTDLAIKRTLMGADRTLMAWLRTALSMISFGFTIYKVLQGLQGGEANIVAQQYNPRNVGLFLVGLGTLSIVMGTIEYWFSVKELRQLVPIRIWRRPSFVMAMIICVAGLSVFISIVTHLL